MAAPAPVAPAQAGDWARWPRWVGGESPDIKRVFQCLCADAVCGETVESGGGRGRGRGSAAGAGRGGGQRWCSTWKGKGSPSNGCAGRSNLSQGRRSTFVMRTSTLHATRETTGHIPHFLPPCLPTGNEVRRRGVVGDPAHDGADGRFVGGCATQRELADGFAVPVLVGLCGGACEYE